MDICKGAIMNQNQNQIDNRPFSVINYYGEDLTQKQFLVNPAIARDEEIKKTIITLLTPDKSALLVGKPGIGKTAIVEGLAYLIQLGQVPIALQGYRIIKLNSTSLVGTIMVNGKEELIMSYLVQELKSLKKTIVFIDEIHTLIGKGESMDLANMLKSGLDRGDVKAIGATTTIEYETYIVRDRAFLRRFEKINIAEPDEETTVKILMGTIPKLESQTGVKFGYNEYVSKLIMESIVSATSEFKRIYGLSAMYPDVSLSILSQSFSQALFRNSGRVTILDVYDAIKTSKRIYPDSIIKELELFRTKFIQVAQAEGIVLPLVTLDQISDGSGEL